MEECKGIEHHLHDQRRHEQSGSKGHIKGVIDGLTSTEDTVACVAWKIKLIAVVFSDWHCQQLNLRIQQYQGGKTPLYNLALASKTYMMQRAKCKWSKKTTTGKVNKQKPVRKHMFCIQLPKTNKH